MSLDNPNFFKECLLAKGVLSRIFRSNCYEVYTLTNGEDSMTNPELISTILEPDPRKGIHVFTNEPYRNKIIQKKSFSNMFAQSLKNLEFSKGSHNTDCMMFFH